MQTKLRQRGYNAEDAWEGASTIIPTIADFTPIHARIAGALAMERQAPVYTTDQAWLSLNLGIPIHVLRSHSNAKRAGAKAPALPLTCYCRVSGS